MLDRGQVISEGGVSRNEFTEEVWEGICQAAGAFISENRADVCADFNGIPSMETLVADPNYWWLVEGAYQRLFGRKPVKKFRVVETSTVEESDSEGVDLAEAWMHFLGDDEDEQPESTAPVAVAEVSEPEVEPTPVVEEITEEPAQAQESEVVLAEDSREAKFARWAAGEYGGEVASYIDQSEGDVARQRGQRHGMPWFVMRSVMHLFAAYIYLLRPIHRQVEKLEQAVATLPRNKRSRPENAEFIEQVQQAREDIDALVDYIEKVSVAEFGVGVISVLFRRRFQLPSEVQRFMKASCRRPWPALDAIMLPELPTKPSGKVKKQGTGPVKTPDPMNVDLPEQLAQIAESVNSSLELAAWRLLLIQVVRQEGVDQEIKSVAAKGLDWIKEMFFEVHDLDSGRLSYVQAPEEIIAKVVANLSDSATQIVESSAVYQRVKRAQRSAEPPCPELVFCVEQKLHLAALRLFCIQVRQEYEQVDSGHQDLAQQILDWIKQVLIERHGVSQSQISGLRASDDDFTVVAKEILKDEGFKTMFDSSAAFRKYAYLRTQEVPLPFSGSQSTRSPALRRTSPPGNQGAFGKGQRSQPKSKKPQGALSTLDGLKTQKVRRAKEAVVALICQRLDAQQQSLRTPVLSGEAKIKTFASRLLKVASDKELLALYEGEYLSEELVKVMAMQLMRAKAISTGVAFRNAGSSDELLEARAKLLCRATLDFTYDQLWLAVEAEIKRLTEDSAKSKQATDAGLSRAEKNPDTGRRMRGSMAGGPSGPSHGAGSKGDRRRRKGKK